MKCIPKDEVDFLIKNYPIHGMVYCAEKLNRTVGAIRHKMSRLKVKRFPNLIVDESYRICSGCKDKKHISEFTPRKRGGYRRKCKPCRALERAKYYDAHRDEINARQNERIKKLRRTSPHFAILYNQRIRMRHLIGSSKPKHTLEYLGCSLDEFKLHIEKGFKDGMSWEKLLSGDIQVDHIIPCSWFDLTKESDREKCFHYTNLQPLWKRDNLAKRDRFAG